MSEENFYVYGPSGLRNGLVQRELPGNAEVIAIATHRDPETNSVEVASITVLQQKEPEEATDSDTDDEFEAALDVHVQERMWPCNRALIHLAPESEAEFEDDEADDQENKFTGALENSAPGNEAESVADEDKTQEKECTGAQEYPAKEKKAESPADEDQVPETEYTEAQDNPFPENEAESLVDKIKAQKIV